MPAGPGLWRSTTLGVAPFAASRPLQPIDDSRMSEAPDESRTLAGAPGSLRGSAPPRVLGDRYLLEERVASGGMASVWRAHDEKLARTVAVKVLHEHLAADEAFRERFRREAIAAAKLSHPNIVGLYDTGADGDHVYLVMEFVAGVTLKDAIADLGTLPAGQAASIGEKVARALDYAHSRGLVHRDVKPANILLSEDGDVKIADFGIAKAEESGSDLTKTGMVLGTAAYVAPEQILARPLDGRADQYGLACVLYEALAGQQPFKGESSVATAAQRLERDPLPLRSLRADIPRGLDEVIMRALARDPDDRYPTAGSFADALAGWADEDADATVATLQATRDAPLTTGPADAPDQVAEPVSFLSTEGRWLMPVVVLLLVAAVLIAVGLASGVIEVGRIPNLLADPDPTAPAEPGNEVEAAPISLAADALRSFDPRLPSGADRRGGDGEENDGRLANIVDGDPDTFWRTDLYNGADFGRLKHGVGVIVDLGQPHRVTSVEITTPSPGISYELRVAEQPADLPGDWQTVAAVSEADTTEEVRLSEPVTTRYLLLWVVEPLVRFDGRWAAALSDLTVHGSPQ